MKLPRVLTEQQDAGAAEAARVLRRGGVVCYPTDTTYALGVNADDQRAMTRLLFMKGRDSHKPISIAVASVERLWGMVAEGADTRRRLHRLLPGPVTVILRPVPGRFARPVANAEGLVGFRVPDHGFCLTMLAEVDFPVTATSANPGGLEAATDVEMLMSYPGEFLDQIDLVIDGGATKLRGASTVMALTESGEVNIVREGVLPRERIWELIQ